MAKLPPKIPRIVSHSHDDDDDDHHHHNQWLDLRHDDNFEIQPPPEHHTAAQPWVNEFMEFSAAKRTSHRRSVSESSVAFTEAGSTVPFLGPGPLFRGFETGDSGNKGCCGDEFDKFDDEQFMCMFSNDIGGGGSSSNLSSTSDHNSTNEDQKRKGGAVGGGGGGGEEVVGTVAATVKNEAEEVESSCNGEKDNGGVQGQGCVESKDGSSNNNNNNNVRVESGNGNGNGNGNDNGHGNVGDGFGSDQQQMLDPKRFKRILANRQSAQRSRVRKLQYISELERSVTALQNEVSILSPRVAFLDHQRMILSVDNSALKAKIAALAQDKIFKDAHQEALKREIERLRQVYYQQQQQQQNLKTTEGIVTPSSSPLPATTIQTPHQPDTIVNENEQFTS